MCFFNYFPLFQKHQPKKCFEKFQKYLSKNILVESFFFLKEVDSEAETFLELSQALNMELFCEVNTLALTITA